MMKHLKFFLIPLVALFILSFYSCEKDQLISDQKMLQKAEINPSALSPSMKTNKTCFNFRVSDTDVPLGCAMVPDEAVPFPCEGGFQSFGAIDFPVTIGDYQGFMTSVVTNMEQSGKKGALHLNLIHYFYMDENSAFWTEDQAVCAPVSNDPSICLVNDVLNIVGGTGIFEGVTGKFHNHGLITFDGGGVSCPNCLGFDPGAPTGRIDYEIFGKICVPNLGPV